MIKIKNKIIESYLYDGSLLLAEKVGNQIQKIYINDGQGIVGMVRPIYDGSNNLTHYQRLYYLYDSLGSVSAVTGEHGLPLQNYAYSPFGTCLNVTDDPINNLQFVGRYGGYLDNDTGLTYFWHRWYDSKDGRWISRDPIDNKIYIHLLKMNKKSQKQYDIDLYRYCFNNPNSYKDITGLEEVSIGEPVDFTIYSFTIVAGVMGLVTCFGGNVIGCIAGPAILAGGIFYALHPRHCSEPETYDYPDVSAPK